MNKLSFSKPIFSVVMPMYNVEKYIEESIQSVLNQSYANFELICVDDGCTDNTLALVERFSDSRLRIVRQKNQGLSAARNTGINCTRGLYVALLDSDDFWHKDKLLSHYKHFEGNLKLGISYSASRFVDEGSRDMGIGQYPKLKNIQPKDIFCRNPIGNGSAAVIRRSFLLKLAKCESFNGQFRNVYFDESLRQSEDVEFWLRAILTSDEIIEGIEPALTYYRVNSGGLSANLESQFKAWNRAAEKNRQLNPRFFNTWYSRAAAYQKRYLARRAVQSRMPGVAFKYIIQAFKSDWRILIEEPGRTILTFFCIVFSFLPKCVYQFSERLFINLMKPLKFS